MQAPNESEKILDQLDISHTSKAMLGAMQSLLKDYQQSASHAKQTWARRSLKGVATLQNSDRRDQLLAWYFLTFCLGYRHGVRHQGGIVTRAGGVGLQQLRRHLGLDHQHSQPSYLACRPPARVVGWIAIDIDAESPYHPTRGDTTAHERLLLVLKQVGLRKPLVLRSSIGEGFHLWLPLAKAVGTFEVATTLHNLLDTEGFEISNGVLELRPNRKSYDADYALIRLPLTGEGNEFWLDGYGLCDELMAFHQAWQEAAPKNRFLLPENLKKQIQEHQTEQRRQRSRTRSAGKNKLDAAQARLAEGFTGRGQSQELKLMAQQIARFAEGRNDTENLRTRCQELLMNAPGFEDFCGHRHEIISGRYWSNSELRRLLEMPVGGYEGTSWEKANLRLAADALSRAQEAIAQAEDQGLMFSSTKSAITSLKVFGAPAYSWWTNAKRKDVLLELRQRLVKQERKLLQQESVMKEDPWEGIRGPDNPWFYVGPTEDHFVPLF
jgi:hypothetical protein